MLMWDEDIGLEGEEWKGREGWLLGLLLLRGGGGGFGGRFFPSFGLLFIELLEVFGRESAIVGYEMRTGT
jgi:hypothetical protein